MNPLQSYLDTVESRVEKATPGEWKVMKLSHVPERYALTFYYPRNSGEALMLDDAKFIAHARQDIPTLLAICRELRGALEFYASEWGPYHGSPIKSVNQFTRNVLNESGEKARQALARAGEICTKKESK